MLQVELVELLKGLEAALSLHVQLEAPPHDTGSAGPVDFDQAAGTGSPVVSHFKSLAERVEQVCPSHRTTLSADQGRIARTLKGSCCACRLGSLSWHGCRTARLSGLPASCR